ncbi:MAG: MFS family permease [Ilumatobacter sp.]|jgi:MFS family permease
MSGSEPVLETKLQARRPGRSLEAAAVAGMVYSVLAVAGMVLLSRFPDLDMSDEELERWLDDPGRRAEVIIGLNLVSISAIAFLWFVAVIRRRLGDREDRFFGTVFFGSSIAYVGIWLVAAAVVAGPVVVLTLFDEASISAESESLAVGIGAALMLVVAPRLQAVFVITVSNVILRSGFLPRWLAYVGFVTGFAMMLMPFVSQPTGLAFPAWVFLVSVIILVTGPGRSSEPDPNPTAE